MDKLLSLTLSPDDRELLLSRIRCRLTKADGRQCYLWQSSTDRHGYPRFHTSLRGQRLLFRVARAYYYLTHYGNFTPFMQVSHLCHDKLCINIDHLSLEPSNVNCQRKWCNRNRKCVTHDQYPECIFLE